MRKNIHERFAEDVCNRLQACFPTYQLKTDVEEMAFGVFATFHLSLDGRDEWKEIIPSPSGGRSVRLSSFHLRCEVPLYLFDEPSRLQHFRKHTVDRFVTEWFAERMKRAGYEP